MVSKHPKIVQCNRVSSFRMQERSGDLGASVLREFCRKRFLLFLPAFPARSSGAGV